MHAAPGGQSCGACDNGIDNVPHLFIDEESWERALLLWEEFAGRYKNRWIVGGYDPQGFREAVVLYCALRLEQVAAQDIAALHRRNI